MKCINLIAVLVINLVLSAFCLTWVSATSEESISLGHFNKQDNGIVLDFKRLNHSYAVTASVQNDHKLKHRRFIPFARPSLRSDNLSDTCSSSSEEFPTFLTQNQIRKGGFLLCIIIGIYCFTLLAIVCNKYFLPCVEAVCDILQISPDVAAATFMSVATSCPELFTNIIGTFVTESDIGIGTIVGSSLFNALGVASIGGLAAVKPIKLDWWPVTRDVCIYIFAVSLLVIISWDELIYWYEGLVLFIIYFVYFTVMFQNPRISRFVKKYVSKRNKVSDVKVTEIKTTGSMKERNLGDLVLEPEKENASQLRVSVISAYGSYIDEASIAEYEIEHAKAIKNAEKKASEKSLFKIPDGSLWRKIFFFYTWPINFILMITVPNPKVHPKLFPITFIMCIIWIGTNSYVVSWMMTLIGSVSQIPDAVLGLTFLAAGGCLPESISITIMSRRGEGAFGVSNSLGANTMNILLSLGMPWFFKTILKGANDQSFIRIQSGSIEYTILALIVVAIVLYLVLYLNKFRLSRKSGVILMSVYAVCVVLAILSEMVFFNNGTCES